ncbi:anti-repressor SinI family protein [Jeotgalibacillus salarius]|uniref:DNA-binding anti-repressor SinI n=1 Tax=Jeotgalibacillus salarius TaxID=546023 RepID=A0A4Y8L7S4_9BACL|nr:anti-repressor SinI family protein [Jeotgalibacillus salarius]TFD98118.1 DNA-binding anti-repressor SinI [Jeotgalibacillus salarius]
MGRKNEVDVEWMALIEEAVEAGISKEEIRDFLEGTGSNSWRRNDLVVG